jgi:thioredoxin 1
VKITNILVMTCLVICLALIWWFGNSGPCCNDVKMAPVNNDVTTVLASEDVKRGPVKGMVTVVDLGAASCIPCKMMAPILDKLEKRYRGKAAVVFIDLRYNQEAVQQFGVQTIPTQIFFDKNGREISRHEGFLGEEAIVARLTSMGVS